jgi:outer membrane murein-binding lipoprotein Lpp
MKQVVFLFAVVSLSSLLGCASTHPQKLSDEEAAMQELNRQRSEGDNAQPAPKPAPKPAKKK